MDVGSLLFQPGTESSTGLQSNNQLIFALVPSGPAAPRSASARRPSRRWAGHADACSPCTRSSACPRCEDVFRRHQIITQLVVSWQADRAGLQPVLGAGPELVAQAHVVGLLRGGLGHVEASTGTLCSCRRSTTPAPMPIASITMSVGLAASARSYSCFTAPASAMRSICRQRRGGSTTTLPRRLISTLASAPNRATSRPQISGAVRSSGTSRDIAPSTNSPGINVSSTRWGTGRARARGTRWSPDRSVATSR